MSQKSKIEWTDTTWNPVRGCTPISPGCKHCYAKTFAERFRGVPGHPFEQGFDLRLIPKKVDAPLHWQTPRLVFVNSMADLFHKHVPTEFITQVCNSMLTANQHIYQLLTKRATRMYEVLSPRWPAYLPNPTLDTARQADHIWWGVSVEDRKYGLPRLTQLQATQVKHRFLSIEPLLEDLGKISLRGIGWVIVGGESGPGARPMKADWVRSIRDQCLDASVPFFFKQWGGIRHKRGGSEAVIDGREWKEFPWSPLGRALQDSLVAGPAYHGGMGDNAGHLASGQPK